MLDARSLIRTLMVTVSNCAMYGNDHANVINLCEGIVLALRESLEDGQDSLDIKIIEESIVLNGVPVPDPGVHGASLRRRLNRKDISQVNIEKGVEASELEAFLRALASPNTDVKSSPHLAVGKMAVELRSVGLDGLGGEGDAGEIRREQLDKLREIYADFSPFRQLNVSGLEDIVVNFIVSFRKQADILSLISPVRSYSEYTYTHATNVAILSMYQAESLNFGGEFLQEIGMGALLHDVGKLFVSKDILDKTGKLDAREWDEIRLHPLYGARYLANIEGLPRIASILAYEHHLRFDGKGYPVSRMGRKTQSFCSQLVAIADFFDALRSRRPYKRDWQTRDIIALMKENAGREFNPVLLDNFTRLMLSRENTH